MFQNLIRLVLSAGLVVTLATGTALADKFEWDEITEDDWSVSQDSAQGIFDAVMLFEKLAVDHKDFEGGRFKRTMYRRIRILGTEGRKWADVEAPFLAPDQDIKEIQGRTILRDGTVVPLDKDKIIEEQVFKAQGEKYTLHTFSLPGVTDDCIVEYMIRYELKTYAGEWIIQKDIPLMRFEMKWVIPEMHLNTLGGFLDFAADRITPNYLWLNTFSDIDVKQLPDLKKPKWLELSCGFVPAFEGEPFTVPDKALKTKLYTYYGSRVPPETYWGEQGRGLVRILSEYCRKNKRVKKVVQRFNELPNADAKIAAAYNWLRDSLLNLTHFDLWEWEGHRRVKIDPKKIEDIDDLFKYRYGYSIDIDAAFVDMLREMNIDARYCYAKDRFDDLFVMEAKYWQLDRSLVAVPQAPGEYKFYTVGHACTPIETVPWFLEGVQTLIGGGNELMVSIPFSPADFSITQTTYEVEITEDLEAFATASSRMTGHDARGVRMELLDEDTADFADMLSENAEALYPDAVLDSLSVEQWDDISQPVLMHCHLTYPDLTTAGSRVLLKPFAFCTSVENPFYAPERKTAVLFDYAHKLEESAFIVLPEGYTVEALPNDTSFANRIGSCTIGFQNMGDKILAQRFFVLNRPFWGVTDYPDVQALFQARKDLSGQVVVLTEGSDDEVDVVPTPGATPATSGTEGEETGL
ncbi:DUF3857 domain-containing protein [bacterium]|nr:DUF3857 domain-containing protein [bacterium]